MSADSFSPNPNRTHRSKIWVYRYATHNTQSLSWKVSAEAQAACQALGQDQEYKP